MKVIRCRIAVFLLFMLPIASPALGGCKDTYPDSGVTTFLSKSEYASCQLPRIRTDYGEIVGEQVRLIAFLKSVYASLLESQSEEQKKGRIEEYETQLSKLRTTWGSIVPTESNTVLPTATDLVGLARDSITYSQSLFNKLESAKAKMDPDQVKTYCKLDFYARVSGGMYAQMRACFLL